MSKRKSVGLGGLQFNRIDPYGTKNEPAAQQSAAPITYHIDALFPDPMQPRHLLPEDISSRFFAGTLSPSAALKELQKRAKQAHATPAIKQTVAALETLAKSIAQQGLINAISIRPKGEADIPAGPEYLIVTGERRWWAHVWLTAMNQPIRTGEHQQAPDRIKATMTEEGVSIRAHQLIENVMREDISLLERAQGMVALREELKNVAHGQQKRVTWQQVEEALGISRAYRIRTMKILDLCDDAQKLVADHNLTERAIRPVAEKLQDKPDLQVAALTQLIAWQEANAAGESIRIAPSLAQYVTELLAGPATQSAAPRRVTQEQPQKLRKQTRALASYFNRLRESEWQALADIVRSDDTYQDVAEDLRYIRSVIDAMVER